MVTMEVKGITWVGNIYRKFENLCLEAEEVIYEDTVKYLENQVQTVGESVKKFYADVMQDLVSQSSCDLDEKAASEWLIDQDNDFKVHEELFLGPGRKPSKVDIKQTRKDLRTNHNVNDDVYCAESCGNDVLLTSASGNSVKLNKFESHARRRVRSTNRIFDRGINENLKDRRFSPTTTSDEITSTETETCRISSCDKKMSPTKTSGEITSTESETCRISSCDKRISPTKTSGEITSTETATCMIPSCEVLNENHEVPHHHAATISNPSSAEVTMPELAESCFNEIGNASAEQIPGFPVFVKSDEVPHHHAASISNWAEVTMTELAESCDNEIENASAEQIPGFPVFVKSDEVPHHHARTISNPSWAEVTMPELAQSCHNEIGNASAEQISGFPVFVTSDEEEETNMSPSSFAVLTGEPNVVQSDGCSFRTGILSRPEGWDFDVDTITEKGHETTEPDHRLMLEQSCVLVNQDELQFVPKAGSSNLRTNKKKLRRMFTLGKKSGRKKEYEELAAWHENEIGELLLPVNTSEPEWELL